MKADPAQLKYNRNLYMIILSGIIYFIIFYVSLFIFYKAPFSFSSFLSLHQDNPLIYLADLFPFALIIASISFQKKSKEKDLKFQSAKAENKLLIDRYAELAKRIGTGNFNIPIVTDGPDDKLGNALIMMQSFLRSNERKEKQQTWISEGKEIISRILRTYNNLDELVSQILNTLINYIDASQGAFFLYDSERNVLVNTVHYSYNNQRFINQEFRIGEGLVGECAYEKDFIYRTEIPEDYFTISSALLGTQKPASLLLIPLISDNNIQGVIEFAFLQEKVPKLTIQFMLELGEIIGRSLHNLKLSLKTEALLVDSQKMTEELRSNEIKLQENARIMEKTQKELQKINVQLESKITEVQNAQSKLHWLLENASEVISIYNRDTKMIYVSPSASKILGYTQEEMMRGKDFERLTNEGRESLQKLIENTAYNEDEKGIIQYSFVKKDGERIFLETSSKNRLNDPAINGIILNSRDITEKIRAEKEERLKSRMQSLSENSLDIILRLSIAGQFHYANPVVEDYIPYDAKSLINKFLSEFEINKVLKDYFINTLIDIAENPRKINTEISVPVKMGEIFSERILSFDAIPEFSNDELDTILFVGHDITEAKKIEKEIQIKNKNINDSIYYAQKIQWAILPDLKIFRHYFPENFVFYRPRDVISGDFPWFYVKDDWLYVAAIDCTGHGVPGALLSFVGFFLLNNIIDDYGNLSPSEILQILNKNVRQTLKQGPSPTEGQDGMDIAFCKINLTMKHLEYAGAYRPLLHFSSGVLTEYKGDRQAIAGLRTRKKPDKKFTNNTIKIKEGDKIFFFTDGLTDQLGGPDGRKYSVKRIKELILENPNYSMKEYDSLFQNDFAKWRDGGRQLDDLLMIGIEF